MSTSDAIAAYDDMRQLADRALESQKGIRIKLESHGAAVHFRQRFYKFRTLDRNQNCKVYEKNDPMYGKSAYDALQATLYTEYDEHRKPIGFAVEVKTASISNFVIEEIE